MSAPPSHPETRRPHSTSVTHRAAVERAPTDRRPRLGAQVERCKKAFEEGRRGELGPKAEALRRRAMARKASPGVKASPPATSSAPSAAKV
jgi:hypothetical protein